MPDAARPDVLALMDAYNILGLDYSADSTAIRRAHKRLAKGHHPDKFPVGSAEQQQATARMAVINDAYGLIREAPLRNQRVSDASDAPNPSTECEPDDVIPPVNQRVDRWSIHLEGIDHWMTVAMIGLVIAVVVSTSAVAVVKTRASRAVQIPNAGIPQHVPPTRLPIGGSSSKKISAQELESQLIQSTTYFADAELRCEANTTDWDFICSYTPADPTIFLRLHFGVNVDGERVLRISRTVPLGVPIPPWGL